MSQEGANGPGDAVQPHIGDSWRTQVENRRRFRFGANWDRYARTLTSERVDKARQSLCQLLGLDDLTGLSFLDVGCGSGLTSLAAAQLGAKAVHSFDYDPEAVSTARRVRAQWMPEARHWEIGRGSVLESEFLARLGTFDIVCAWGVLHHTGDMRRAIEHVVHMVTPGGLLALAIYNDQGKRSRSALALKRRYLQSSRARRLAILMSFAARQELEEGVREIVRGRNPLRRYRDRERGMSVWHDIVDWVGGYPFEVAKPEEVLAAVRPHGYELIRLRTAGCGPANNEFLFERTRPEQADANAR